MVVLSYDWVCCDYKFESTEDQGTDFKTLFVLCLFCQQLPPKVFYKFDTTHMIQKRKKNNNCNVHGLKFIYSEKATKFCEIFTYLLTVCTVVKS